MATVIVNPPTGAPGAVPATSRHGVSAAAAVDNAAIASSDVIDIRDYKQIGVKPAAGITSLTLYSAETASGTFVIVDSIGTNGVITVVASKWNTLDPTKIGPYGFIKFLGNAAGTVVVQGKS